MRRHPGPERLGQVDDDPPALDAAPARRRNGAHLRARRVQGVEDDPATREPRLGRGLVLQEDVGHGEPRLRGALLRHDLRRRRTRRSRTSSSGSASRRSGRRVDGEPLARHAAEGRAGARAPDVAGAAPARRADDRARPALEARGAGVHPRGLELARRHDPALHARHGRGRVAREPGRDPAQGDLLCLEPAEELKRRYGAETLEEAFFAATGASLEEEEREEDKDDEREVWA